MLSALLVKVLEQVLEFLDGSLLKSRDKERYQAKDLRSREIDTLFGKLRFSRRTYLDRETGQIVALLDEALGLEKRERLSPGLVEVAVLEGVEGASYRAARDSLERIYEYPPVSHETIRQRVLEVGDAIGEDLKRELADPAGERKVPVLLIEADGLYVSRQGAPKQETKKLTSHEGWERKSPSGKEYSLVHRRHYVDDGAGEDFWETGSRKLYSEYDLADTWVAINGDRAKWIREGMEYFHHAMYQFDRFHLKRDFKRLLRLFPEEQEAARRGLEGDNPDQVLAALCRAQEKAPKDKELLNLIEDLASYPQGLVDYRMRLREKGVDVTGLRALGAAESNVARFKRRLQGRGQSWGQEGLRAILRALGQRFEGRLRAYAHQVAAVRGLMETESLKEGVRRITFDLTNTALASVKGNVPIMGAGANASHGLSKLFSQDQPNTSSRSLKTFDYRSSHISLTDSGGGVCLFSTRGCAIIVKR